LRIVKYLKPDCDNRRIIGHGLMLRGIPTCERHIVVGRVVRQTACLIFSSALLLAAPAAKSQQFQPDSTQAQLRLPAADLSACSDPADAVRTADRRIQRDRHDVASSPGSDSSNRGAGNAANGLDSDLSDLHQSEAALNNCLTATFGTKVGGQTGPECGVVQFLSFEVSPHDGEPNRTVPIWRRPENPAFFYESGMMIDADGAPNAYHPDNIGLDDLSNAGEPGVWEGLAKDEHGTPYIQGPDDPFPGYYVSETALADRTKAPNDPARYVDATKIPFIVLPGGMDQESGARRGDFAVVFNLQDGKMSPAIFADTGPDDSIGEGSVALAENLGIRSDARNGGVRRGVLYLVFPGSGNGRPRSVGEINSEAARLFKDWLDSKPTKSCGAL
jgi:hypothetical protein